MIEMGKKYKTRSGLPVRILCTDLKNKEYPIVAAIMQHNEEGIASFTETGKFIQNEKSELDLIEETPYDDFKEDDLCVVWDEKSVKIFRYFSNVKKGTAHCFDWGCTSYSAEGTTPWTNCRKATEEEIRTKTIKD